MKIKINSNENNNDFKINNPNIPNASDFNDILNSLSCVPSDPQTAPALNADQIETLPIAELIKQTAEGIQVDTATYTEDLSQAAIKPEALELSLEDKVSKYVQTAEHQEQKEKHENHKKYVKVEAHRIEKELKQIDPEFAKATATSEEEKQHARKLKKQNSIPWRNYMAYFVIITALSACVTFSKYISTVGGDATAIVAKFDVQIESDSGLTVNYGEGQLTFDGYLGTDYLSVDERSKDYEFTVRNQSEVSIDLTYSVTGSTHHAVNLTPTTATLMPGQETEVILSISPAETNSVVTDHITVSFNSIQKD